MKFDPVTTTDLNEILTLQPEGWSDIITDNEFYINSHFCFPIKTSINGKIIGIGATLLFKDTAWLAHIIVNTEYRKQGIGLEIVYELLRINEEKRIKKSLLIATTSGLSIYQKLGFEIVSEYTYLNKKGEFPEFQLSENIIPYQEAHYNSLIQLDKFISAEDREVLLRNYLEDAIVYIEDDEVKGYYLPQLGDGPIIAASKEIGIELMKVKYSDAVKAVIPEQNKVAIKFLKNNGYELSNTRGIRMIRGEDIS